MARMMAGRSCDFQLAQLVFQPLQAGGGHRKLLHGAVLEVVRRRCSRADVKRTPPRRGLRPAAAAVQNDPRK